MRVQLFLFTLLNLIPLVSLTQGYNFLFKHWEDQKATSITFDYKENKLVVDTIYNTNDIRQAITFTDKDGKCLGYFNGHQVRNLDGSIAENGDSLAWTVSLGATFIDSLDRASGGNGVLENAIILPTKSDSLFLLFYLDYMFLADIDNFFLPYMLEADEFEFRFYSKALLVSYIHLRSNGKLEVDKIKKDIPIVEDFLMYRNLMAVPHANGSDYWIISPCQHENTAYSILVSDTTIEVKGKHFFSENNTKYIWPGFGTSKFSENGDKLLRYNYRYGRTDVVYESGWVPCVLEVMDFDRCTGTVVPGTSITDLLDVPWFGTAEFSPSSEFLYIGGVTHLARCSTKGPSYFDKMDTIYRIPYEGLTSNELYNNYDHSESLNRLPNGQIICHSYWQTPYFHLITNPDAPDVKDIGYRSRAIILPEKEIGSDKRYKAGGMPRHVNLKMAQKTCIIEAKETNYVHNIRVYPNPVIDVLYLTDYTDQFNIAAKFSIIDLVTGQIMIEVIPHNGIIDVSSLKSGLYGIKIDAKVIKFVKI